MLSAADLEIVTRSETFSPSRKIYCLRLLNSTVDIRTSSNFTKAQTPTCVNSIQVRFMNSHIATTLYSPKAA